MHDINTLYLKKQNNAIEYKMIGKMIIYIKQKKIKNANKW